jgi:electron transfer flavoprotein alpha subunit
VPDRNTILVVLESHDGELRGSSYEAFAAGRSLADELGASVVALAVGSGISQSANDLGGYGADRVLVADVPELNAITVDGYAKALDMAIEQVDPGIVMMVGTTGGRDILAFLAGMHRLAHLPDCTDLRVEEGNLIGKRPVYGNKMMTEVRADLSSRVLVSLHTGAFKIPEPDASKPVEAEMLDLSFDDGEIRMKITGLESSSGGPPDIGSAEIVVIGGRGLGSKENYELVQQLAEALGGSAGATRAVTDLGWRPHYEQVGQTGHKISPKLYVGIGVSGAVQHTVGMVGSETIVAVNRDPAAPIFKLADFGLVADLEDVVPKLVEKINARKGT